MPIQREASGFFEWHDRQDRVPLLGLVSGRVDQCVERFDEGGFQGLFGTGSFGFAQKDLDCLARFPTATHIWFWDVTLRDILGIYSLTRLRYFGINPKRPGIDFGRFPALQTVINWWIKDDRGLAKSPIANYHLWHYKPRLKTFSGLELPLHAKSMELFWANPATLEGLPVMPELEVLGFHRCRNLIDLSALPRIAPNLRTVFTTTCSKIEAGPGILDHPTLTRAAINGKVVLLRNGS